mgnify:CR=1 FL=1
MSSLTGIVYPAVAGEQHAFTATTTVIAAPGSGLRLFVSRVVVSWSATSDRVVLVQGSGGTTQLIECAAANGPVEVDFGDFGFALPANEALEASVVSGAAGDVTVSAIARIAR